jgi:hypothetical protein
MPRVVEYSSPAEQLNREPAMARKPEDSDDSEDLPMPDKAEINRILRGVVPTTPDWVKEKTAETRGQAYAHYDGSGAPAKAKRDDTLDIAGPVVVDDTNVEGLQLSPLTLQRIEKRRQDAEQRNDSTVSVDMAQPSKRKSILPIVALLLVGVVAIVIWLTRSKTTTPTDVPITPATISASATTVSTASSPINVAPVPTVVESATASATPATTTAVAATSSPGTSNVKPLHTASASPTVSSTAPATHPSASASGRRPDLAVTPF